MLTVHHLGMSRSDRIVWLCEELGVPYELKRYERDPDTMLAPPELRALTPFGLAPVITEGDLVLGESAAIIEYLIQTRGGGRLAIAPRQPGYADYLYWFHFAEGSLMPAAMFDMIVGIAGSDHGLLVALKSQLDRAYAQIEARLGEAPYLAGNEFTAADIVSVFPLTTMRLFWPHDISRYSNIRAYLHRISQRAAFKSALQRADPGLELPMA